MNTSQLEMMRKKQNDELRRENELLRRELTKYMKKTPSTLHEDQEVNAALTELLGSQRKRIEEVETGMGTHDQGTSV